MKTNSLAQTAQRFIDACRQIPFTDKPETVDLAGVLETLPHIHLDENYTLECSTPGTGGMGGESTVYALRKGTHRPKFGELLSIRRSSVFGDDEAETAISELDPLSHITVEKSPEGLWEYHLLTQMWRFLPLWWHANYAEQTYITDADAVSDIAHVTEELKKQYEDGKMYMYEFQPYGLHHASDVENAINLTGDAMVLPSVTMVGDNGDTGEITYTYWSEWGGLTRESIIATVMEDGQVISMGKPRVVKLVNYECGIMF